MPGSEYEKLIADQNVPQAQPQAQLNNHEAPFVLKPIEMQHRIAAQQANGVAIVMCTTGLTTMAFKLGK